MEIKNSLLRNVDPYRTQLGKQQDAAKKTSADTQNTAATSGDRVSLSPSARLHTAAHAAVSSAPELRQEKVDALKERVDSGNYTVDSRKVAEKLLQSEGSLARTLGGLAG